MSDSSNLNEVLVLDELSKSTQQLTVEKSLLMKLIESSGSKRFSSLISETINIRTESMNSQYILSWNNNDILHDKCYHRLII